MKNTPAVFFTSLAVSAISLTVPMPAATTVLDLFIGEDITAQHIAPKECENRQRTTYEVEGEDEKTIKSNTDWETFEQLRKLSLEQGKTEKPDSEAAFTRIRNSSGHDARSRRT